MKKLYKFLICLIISLCLVSVVSCDFTTINTDDKTKVVYENYIIKVADIPSYSTVTEDNVAQIVAAVVMPATLEIECKIKFSYSAYTYSGFFNGRKTTQTGEQSGLATGMVINEDGYILTNAHVVCVENSSSVADFQYISREIKVNYADTSEQFDCELVCYDEDLDLCILKMDTTKIQNLKYVTFFNETNPESEAFKTESAVKLYYGETAIAIGNANGYGISVTKGVISAPYRIMVEGSTKTYAIQTDASINEGNSGGPLCNSYCAVIGINTFKIVTDTSEGMGYAVPTYKILPYIDVINTTRQTPIKYYTTTSRSYTAE